MPLFFCETTSASSKHLSKNESTPGGWLGHNSFELYYRSPFGAVPTQSGKITLRYSTLPGTTHEIKLNLKNQLLKTEQWLSMQKTTLMQPLATPTHFTPTAVPMENWEISIDIPTAPTVLSYFFEIHNQNELRFALTHDSLFYTGGWSEESLTRDDARAFKITVYNSNDHVPDWIKGAVIYQILPDRYRNGNPSNDPKDGQGWIYGKSAVQRKWMDPICNENLSDCYDKASRIFYGGDLKGITDKLDEIQNLGVTAIYLNPIFLAPSNHKYDTQDYLQIDPNFGTQEEFNQLANESRTRGLRLILDGVFNHTSADSPYFDFYNRWSNKNLGACQSSSSIFRSWFFLPAYSSPGLNEIGQPLLCAGVTFEAWAGVASLPKLNVKNSGVRDLLYAKGKDSVGPHWIAAGASGWRLDVGDMVDPGHIIDPQNGFWKAFKASIRNINPESILLGEQWSDGRNWLLGDEWDSLMNYRFRSAVLSWMFDECQGHGCDQGKVFSNKSDNEQSVSGTIHPLSMSQFEQRMLAIQEDYPPEHWLSMMNLLDSHDTSRILFMLKKISKDSATLARQKLRFLALFQFTYPGAPTIYYGNEVGLAPDDIWDGDNWENDPFNRATYPWADRGGHPDINLRNDFAKLAKIHNNNPQLKQGDYLRWNIDNQKQIMAFGRALPRQQKIWIVLNRKNENQTIEINAPEVNEQTELKWIDLLSGESVKTKDGKLQLENIPALWGKILTLR